MPSEPARAPGYVIGSVDRALRVLLLLRARGPVTLTAVSRELDVAPSTAHRLLATLLRHDFVRQDAVTRAYLPGRMLLEIGLAAVGSLDVRRRARPELETLARDLEETAHLVLRDRDRVLFLDTVESPRAVRVTDRTGTTLPAHCTAAGKVLLAQLDRPALRGLLGAAPLERLTPRSCVDLDALERELRQIRARGYATNFAESERGLSAVAAAVPAAVGAAGTMSVTVSVPSEHIAAARERELADAVIAAAERVGALEAGDPAR
ncbi:MAG TPA: IclR family transcriptional regulator [Euzebyales bacterium]|nr:IclR family transcriptional regulator [Euzebyales bacterium]